MNSALSGTSRLAALFATATLLVACGGGGGAPSTPTAPKQTVSAACKAKQGLSGYDVVLLIGQSNMSGYGGYFVPGFDTTDVRIQQLTRGTSVELAIDPLKHPDAPFNVGRIGPGMSFARAYLRVVSANRKVLLVPASYRGTGFSDARWNPGNDLFEAAVTQTEEALATDSAGNCMAAVLWSQGESDVGQMSAADYRAALDRMIIALRTRLGILDGVPFILGQFSPDWTGPTPSVEQQALLDVINDTPNRVAFTAVSSTAGLTSNVTQGLNGAIHLDAASQRIYGQRYHDAVAVAMSNSANR